MSVPPRARRLRRALDEALRQPSFLIGMIALRASRYFDRDYYLSTNPDVHASGVDPLQHYLRHGAREGRNPSRHFSTVGYLAANPDVEASGSNPLLHFVLRGRREGRSPLGGSSRARPHLLDGYRLPLDPRAEWAPIHLPVGQLDHELDPRIADAVIGVHVHCYFVDALPTIASALARIPLKTALFISVPSEPMIARADAVLQQHGLSCQRYAVVPNRGRDLAPMLVTFKDEIAACDVVLHMHTKRSTEREALEPGFGRRWLDDLNEKLLYNRSYISGILGLFAADPTLGLVMPEPFDGIRPFMVWGACRDGADVLMRRLGHSLDAPDDGSIHFPAGSMMWFRPAALASLYELGLDFDDFPAEPVPDDGTLSHVIERILPMVASGNGHRHATVTPLPYESCWPQSVSPLVSVIVPVYNSLPWVNHAVQSVLAQDATHAPTEIVLVDNGSDDGSRELLDALADRHQNVRVASERMRGAGAARNRGMREARGRYLMFLDADDLLATDAINRLLAALQADPEIDFATSSLVVFDEDGYRPQAPFRAGADELTVLDSLDVAQDTKTWTALFSDFGPCAKLYRRAFLEGHDITFPAGRNFEDNSFVFDAYMAAHRIGVVARPTYFYRRYRAADGATQSTSTDKRSFLDQLTALEDIVHKHHLREPGMRRDLASHAVVVKLAREVSRLEHADWAIEATRASDALAGLIEERGLWHLLDRPSGVARKRRRRLRTRGPVS